MIYSLSPRWFVLIPSLAIVTLLLVCPTNAQVVAQYTFESGTQGWTSKTGPRTARVWTLTANNPSTGTAYTLQINRFKLRQLGLSGPCNPMVTPPSSFPVALGDLAAGGSTSISFTINFAGCGDAAPFVLEMPWSAANGADGHTLVRLEQP